MQDLQHVWFFNQPRGPAPTSECEPEYLVIGWEGAKPPHDGSHPHLQVYIELDKPTTFQKLKKWFPKAHIEPRYGSPDQASAYCKKEGQWAPCLK